MQLLKLLPRFRDLNSALREYEERERWSATEIQTYQLERLNRVWAHARRKVPFYRELSNIHDLPEQFGSLDEYSQQMPLLSKQHVRRSPHRFISCDAAPGGWQRTGGSTGTPMEVYWEHDAHRTMLRAKYRCEQAHGLDVFDNKVMLWGHRGSFPSGVAGQFQKMVRPFQDRLRHRLRVSAYDLSSGYLRSQLPRIQAFRPRSLYGYSSAVYLLAETAAAIGVELPELKVAVLTAEPADGRMLSAVQEKLRCTAVIEYGAVECGLIAYLMPDGLIHTRDDVVFLETVPGERGAYDMAISVLGNASFPLLRYCIEDTTSMPRQQSEKGFGILADVQGRNNDVLASKSGRRLHPMAVKHVIDQWPEIRRFTARQYASGQMKVTLEALHTLDPKMLRRLQHRLRTLLEGYAVEIETVDRIPGNLAGKHRWIISDLARQAAKTSNR